MRESARIVVNTGPLLALIAGTGDRQVLRPLYQQVVVPWEVCQEILAGGRYGFGIHAFAEADWLCKWPTRVHLTPVLRNSLDPGEASVVQMASDQGIATVCIDEPVGRRVARLHGLAVTGSLGILIHAKREGGPVSVRGAIERMVAHGIWLAPRVMEVALREAGE